jgi:hypothetical protein
MKTIQVSEEVFDFLNSKAIGFEMSTPDAVLRNLLGINASKKNPNESTTSEPKILLRWKGVDFPEGMQMRFKGRPNEVATIKSGSIVYRGKQFPSPSKAAIEANNGTSTNGWIHWEYLDKSGDWKLIDNLRTHK